MLLKLAKIIYLNMCIIFKMFILNDWILIFNDK